VAHALGVLRSHNRVNGCGYFRSSGWQECQHGTRSACATKIPNPQCLLGPHFTDYGPVRFDGARHNELCVKIYLWPVIYLSVCLSLFL